ncbi:uncharacterized protein [Rutidosis leptorrhynchoides]|uniref:uncharacterized protein n=1 Tax=Rutidosis leptorrhynchoides TaxID=125765 RepID=UPI003A99008F
MSPYLFMLVMEVLTLMLKRNISQAPNFRFHPKSEKFQIVNLCFADNLFIFAHANISSVNVIRDAMEEFKNCSGLVPSLPNTAFFCNVSASMKNSILATLPFEEGRLPVRYLGVPLVSSRLVYCDCKILVERVKYKVDNWMNKFLSFARRVQLIVSVLTSMQIYWCSVFILPDMIIKDMKKLLRGFLWCQGPMKRGKAKVKWDDMCLPKVEGGLGIKRLKSWNVALMASHAWQILTFKPSLWVKWTYEYKLASHHFWRIELKAGAAWSWWGMGQPDQLGMTHGVIWELFLILCHIMTLLEQSFIPPVLSSVPDKYGWKDSQGMVHDFSVSRAWNSLRPQGNKVPWFSVVWYSQCVPRHAFLLWLVLGEKLKTQDKLKPWESQDWHVIVEKLTLVASRKLAHILVAKLCFAATIYSIWQERNFHLFKQVFRTEQQVFEAIVSNTRLNLLTIWFKNSPNVARIRSTWHIEEV